MENALSELSGWIASGILAVWAIILGAQQPKKPEPEPLLTPPIQPDTEPATPKPTSAPIPAPEPILSQTKQTNRERLYEAAYDSLSLPRGLDKSIDKSVNCANAATHVMILAGVKGLPKLGIAGTAMLYAWLLRSPLFGKISETEIKPGDLLIWPTTYGNGSIRGHIFVAGKFQLMSNDSSTGRWNNHWIFSEAKAYYTGHGGIPMSAFRYLG